MADRSHQSPGWRSRSRYFIAKITPMTEANYTKVKKKLKFTEEPFQ